MAWTGKPYLLGSAYSIKRHRRIAQDGHWRSSNFDRCGRFQVAGRGIVQGCTRGFGIELCLLKQVGNFIAHQCGVRFSDAHVWHIPCGLGFSSRKPEKRAIERRKYAARQWCAKTWNTLQRMPSSRGGQFFCGRVGSVRAAHLGAEERNAGHPIPFQLDA